MSKQFWKLGLATVVAVTGLAACIAPPPKPLDGGASEANKVKDIDFVPVKPAAPLIWAGENRIIKNIDPPGSWFILNDGGAKGKMIPATTEEFDAAIVGTAIHTEGSGYSNWGGGIGFNLAAGDVQIGVDAKQYKGISFKAKGKGFIHFALATVATMPEFGACTRCYDHYAVDIRLSDDEKEYVYTWDQLKQGGWGNPKVKMDTGALTGMFFTSKGPSSWNITVGDIKFVE